MSLKEELKNLKSSLAELKDRIEADDAEAIAEGEKLQGEIEAKTAEIEQAEKKAALLNVIGKKEEVKEMGEVKAARNLGEHVVNHLKEANVGKRFNFAAPAFKANTDTQVTPTASGVLPYATTYDRNVVTAVRTPLVIRDLFGAETISGSTLVYLVEGAIEGDAAITAEGAEKSQVHFADPTPVTVSLSKITEYIKESDEYIKDYAFLESAINGRLLYQLGLFEQNQLMTWLAGTANIQTGNVSYSGAADIADALLKGSMDVQEETGFAADAIVLSPADWYTLRVGKDGNEQYYGGGYFGQQNVPNLWGIPVCVTSAVATGTAWVGAFKTCGSVVQNGGVGVEMTNTDQDDFIKNLMTIRAEERIALAVRRPKGFKKLTLTASA